jgi:thioredoxin-related protein
LPLKRLNIFILFLFILITIPAHPACSDSPGSKSTVKWESFNSGLSKALKQKKYVIIDFYADWCYWCKVMEKETFANQEVVKVLNRDFVAVKVYTEKDEEITYMGVKTTSSRFASMLGVTGLPTVVFMDGEGKLIDQVPGFVKPDIFVSILRYISEGCYKQQITFADYMNKKAGCGK